MSSMRRRSRRWMLCSAAVAAVLTTSCSTEGGTSDKAGGTGDPVVLRMATINGDLAFTPQVRYLVDRVEEVSEGSLRIEMVYEVGGFQHDSEQQVVRGVAGGEYDLGVVGTQVFDTLGVTSFRALTAPMLVDSYPVQAAVIESGITDRMMQGLTEVDVTGVAVLAGALRKPVAVEAPLVGPRDWRGVTFSTFRSEGQFQAIRALDASAVAVLGDARDQALREGSLDGFESSLLAYRLNAQEETAPYLTPNVTLWPQTLAAVANPDLDSRLTDEQRDWLGQAADEAAGRSSALADTDAQSLEDICAAGARLTEASEAELAALEEAFASVYADFRQDPETREFLDQIQALKALTSAEPALSIPADCAGEPPSDDHASTGTSPRYLNGVYRYTITKQDAIAAGEGDDPEYPLTQTWWLENGSWTGSGGSVGNYWVNGDRISFEWTEPFEAVSVFTLTRDDDGNLTLEPAEPMDPGDAFLLSGTPRIKIG